MDNNLTAENPAVGSSQNDMSAFGEIDRFDFPIKQTIPKKDLIKKQKMVKQGTLEGSRLRKGFSINFAANIDILIEDYGDTVQIFTD